MTLAEVHPIAQSMLSASQRVSQFSTDLIEDGVTDNSEVILKKLQDEGACIVMGDVTAGEGENATWPVQATVTLPVFVYDQPGTEHTPSGKLLTDAVISALTLSHTFLFSAFAKFTNEKGGTLTVCEFHAKIVFAG